MKCLSHRIWIPVLFCGVLMSATAAHAQQSVRGAVGGPLQAAQQLIQSKDYVEALAQVDAAEQVGKLTDYERSIIFRIRAVAAIGAGQNDVALSAYEQLLQTDQLTAVDRPPTLEVAIKLAYGAKAYDKVVQFIGDYQAAGGSKPEILELLPQAHYLAGDWAGAASALKQQIAALERAGQRPSKTQLHLLTSCALKLDDQAAYVEGMEYLVRYYPSADYWMDLIARAANQPGFPQQQLALDVYRLRKATQTMSQASDYMEAAQLALQAGYPGEAQGFVDEGYARQLLGNGPEAEQHHRLKEQVASKLVEDRKTLESGVVEARKQASGDALVAMGLNYAGYGDSAKAAELIEQGIQKGQLKNPDLVQMHLGYVLLQGANNEQAVKVLRDVKEGGGAKALAQLWNLVASAKG